MSGMRLIAAAAGQRSRWKNDGGWTTELARSADRMGTDFRWRVSIAEIEGDGPFSLFPGVERELLLLDGTGIELDIGDAPARRLSRRFEHIRFDGAAHVHCRLLAGPTRDFNVMAKPDAVRAEVVARPLVGAMMMFAEPRTEWLVHLLSGHAQARRDDERAVLQAGDSLHLDFRGGTDAKRVVLAGAGEAVFARFVALDG